MARRRNHTEEQPDASWTPTQAVEDPILNSPYEEPKAHWVYRDGRPFRQSGRRPASYWFRTRRTGSMERELFAEEERDDLPLVNRLREDVARWRRSGYRGAEKATGELLRHWSNPDRPRRLFFCQIEAAETLIYLLEIALPGRLGSTRFQQFRVNAADLSALLRGEPPAFEELAKAANQDSFHPRLIDPALDAGLLPLVRLGCKMATGSGKTLVMAMLIAWAFCNRGNNPASRHFPNGVLVCAPNLTVKNRLQVLRPESPDNYYDAFGLVPPAYREHLNCGRVLVTNWHVLAPASEHSEGGASYKVVNKGEESDEAFARNRLGDLAERMPLLVFNDEGHHCWRPRPDLPEDGKDLTPEEKEALEQDREKARVWLTGLDRINNCGLAGKGRRGILACVDLSATPFYLSGSGYPEGSPFPWLVSDFGLVDAIECGIVKVPRLPVKDDRDGVDEAGRPDPAYFRLWDHVVEQLGPGDRVRRRPKAEALFREAQPALTMLYSQWKARFEQVMATSRDERPIPPVMIVVCENTDLARVFYEEISGERVGADGSITRSPTPFPEFANTETERRTFRIDTKLLAKAEAGEGESRDQAAQALRELINTVGTRGKPGEQVRCVVSVSMLTEGWDANNVTHVLGLRPFRSQLLCEQVVGRGLRRTSYTPDPATGLLPAEYVDVYGIPFSLIPFKGKPRDAPDGPDPVYHHVHALEGREAFEIRVPVVNGFTYSLRSSGLRCDIASIPQITIDEDPTTVYLSVTRGYVDGAVSRDQSEFVAQTREEFYKNVRVQQIVFRIAQEIVHDLEQGQDRAAVTISRHQLFPEIVRILDAYIRTRVRLADGVDLREIAHKKHVTRIRSLVLDAIQPGAAAEEAPLLPIINRFKPSLSTADVNERTARPVIPLEKSHLNYAVVLSRDEEQAIRYLEDSPHVECFVANTRHLGLQIPYEYNDTPHTYIPDFIVRLAQREPDRPCHLVLEIKGWGGDRDPNQVAAKSAAARKWVAALSNLKRYGVWYYDICHEVALLPRLLAEYGDEGTGEAFPWIPVPRERQKPWENCLPVVSLKAAAGGWSREQISFEDNPSWAETWVRPCRPMRYEKGMFIAQVQGDSMEPLIPSGGWCAFRPPRPGTCEGKVVLVWHSGIADPHTGGQYTVKRYHAERRIDPEKGRYHTRIHLNPINRAYPPIVLEPRDAAEVRVVAEFVAVLRP